MKQGHIAITGMGAISALGASPEALWRGLLAGKQGILPIRRFSTEGCRVVIAGEAPDPVLPLELSGWAPSAATRTGRLALHAALDALKQARLPSGRARRTALVLGSAGGGDAALEAYLTREVEPAPSRVALAMRCPKRAATDFVGSALRLGGPRVTVNTACSSGAVAVSHASELLQARMCDAALAGGADELTRYTLTGFCSLRAVDPEPCRPFDRQRRGVSIGEGAGIVVLERLQDAQQRGAEILGIVCGTGHSCDAGHLTAPDLEGRGAALAIAAALADAGVAPAQIGFVNAHGSGTPHNDRAEVKSLQLVLQKHAPSCPVHSAKSCIGHCMGAAGALEMIVTVASLRDGLVPHTLALTEPEFDGQLDFVRSAPQRIQADYGLTNSLGFGGNNAALVLARPEVVSQCG